MLTTLIRRELLDNLITFRFTIAISIMLVMIVVTTVILIKNYEHHLVNYNAAIKIHQQELSAIKTYSAAQLYVYRPPNPLSLFNIGLDRRLGDKVWVHHGFIPSLWDAKKQESNPLFLNLFSSIDIVFIFEGILSLMALMFAYDTVAREHESGTLRLVLIHPVGRGHILFAKYISAMICLLIPLLLSILFAILLLTTSPSLSLSRDDFLRIGGIIFVSIMYLSVFYLIGLLISVTVCQMNTALMLSIFVWSFLVIIYPNLIRAEVVPQHNIQARKESAFNQIQQIWNDIDRQRKQYLATDGIEGEDPNFNLRFLQGARSNPRTRILRSTLQSYHIHRNHLLELHEKSKQRVPYVQNYYHFLEPLVIRTASRVWKIRKQALEEIFVQPATTHKNILEIFPSGQYDGATQALAGTDFLGIQDFFGAVRQYRETVIDYLYTKDAFASPQWFTADKGALDWSTFPQFSYQSQRVSTYINRALPNIAFLLITSVILFFVSYLIFIRREI